MKNLARIFALLGYFALASMPLNAAAVVVIDFGTGLANAGGTISWDGVNAVGTDIPIGAMVAEGTSADGTYPVHGPAGINHGVLNFDTVANEITVEGIVGGGLNVGGPTPELLLSGSFTDFSFQSIPGPGGTTTEIVTVEGTDVKSAALLTELGVDVNTPFEFFGFSIESVNGNVVSTDIINTVVPVPAAVWLFGSGLLGLVGIARRKKAA